MTSIRKTAIVGYSAEQMYTLVADIGQYPAFLPWCVKTSVQPSDDSQTLLATLCIDFHGFSHSFTTRNRNTAPQSISMRLEKGPFKRLDGQWRFTPLPNGYSRVDLELHYEFSGWLFEKMLAPIFDMVSLTLVDAFHARARQIYGIP